jgi:hypothetical protein
MKPCSCGSYRVVVLVKYEPNKEPFFVNHCQACGKEEVPPE